MKLIRLSSPLVYTMLLKPAGGDWVIELFPWLRGSINRDPFMVRMDLLGKEPEHPDHARLKEVEI